LDWISNSNEKEKKVKRIISTAVTVVFVLGLVGSALAVGPAVIELPASMGKVTFPHKLHQDVLKDCKKCHAQAPGKIKEIGKFWAHETCRQCHVAMKTDGKTTGPTNCSGGHKK